MKKIKPIIHVPECCMPSGGPCNWMSCPYGGDNGGYDPSCPGPIWPDAKNNNRRKNEN